MSGACAGLSMFPYIRCPIDVPHIVAHNRHRCVVHAQQIPRAISPTFYAYVRQMSRAISPTFYAYVRQMSPRIRIRFTPHRPDTCAHTRETCPVKPHKILPKCPAGLHGLYGRYDMKPHQISRTFDRLFAGHLSQIAVPMGKISGAGSGSRFSPHLVFRGPYRFFRHRF